MSDRCKYTLKDGMNGDIVCETNSLQIVKSEAIKYDDGCEGDWLPFLYVLHDDKKYHLCGDFKF